MPRLEYHVTTREALVSPVPIGDSANFCQLRTINRTLDISQSVYQHELVQEGERKASREERAMGHMASTNFSYLLESCSHIFLLSL